MKPAWLFLFLFSFSTHSVELIENFSTRADFESGTAVWNHGLGVVHPKLQVMNFKPGFTPLAVDIGDGRHGAFEVSRYAEFSAGGDISGNIIRFDTDIYPILQVTSFHLANGWTLRPVGSNPLIIYSLSDVLVEGDIDCSGANGENAVGSMAGAGGLGRCGGANGGAGGATGLAGADGDDADATVTGGEGGNFTGGAAVGGGGGGSWNTTSMPANGPNSAGLGGAAGTSQTDPEFLNLAGGAGGGGGSGTGATAGAGGGGGGGTVVIHAARDFNLGTFPTSADGFIYTNGGKGGDSNVIGGPGGGGGGGGVLVFVGRTINIYNNDAGGAGLALNGQGGTNSVPAGGAVGGLGRNWYSSVNYNGIGFYTPSEEAPVVPGNVEFVSVAQNVVSRTFDLESTLTTIHSMSVSPISSDFVVEASGSSDGFQSDDTGWTSNVSLLNNKRFFRFRITITSSNVNNPDMVNTLTVNYTPGVREEFAMKTSGCGRMSGGSPLQVWPFLMLLILGIALKLVTKHQHSIREH